MDRPRWSVAPYLESAYSLEALSRCGNPVTNKVFEDCIEKYWEDRIAKEIPEDWGYDPGYQYSYYNYLALRVQRNVEEILEIRSKYPNWEPEKFKIKSRNLVGYDFEKKDESNLLRYRQTINKINQELQYRGYDQRIDVGTNAPSGTIFRNLRDFFDQNKRMLAKADELYRDTFAASTILAGLVRTCDTCHALFIDISPSEYPYLSEFFQQIQGIRRLNPSIEEIFSKFNVKVGPGTMLLFRNRGNIVYTLYIDDEGKRYELTVFTAEDRIKRLPRLYIDFLQSRGIISAVGDSLYPVSDLLKVPRDEKWI